MYTAGSVIDADLIASMAGRGEWNDQIDLLHGVIEEELDNGSVLYTSYGVSVLIQLLLERDASGDLEQARHVLTRFEEMVGGLTLPVLDLWALQGRARLAGAAGDKAGYTHLVNRYRDLAKKVDARGHLLAAAQLVAEPALG